MYRMALVPAPKPYQIFFYSHIRTVISALFFCNGVKRRSWNWSVIYRVFSHDVTAAILKSQNKETAAMLVSQTSSVGVELFSYANAFFCSNKFAKILATWVKTLYWIGFVPHFGAVWTDIRAVKEVNRELKQRQRWRLQKSHLKMEFALPQT